MTEHAPTPPRRQQSDQQQRHLEHLQSQIEEANALLQEAVWLANFHQKDLARRIRTHLGS